MDRPTNAITDMKRKLLLADDDPIVRDVLREILAQSDRFDLVAEAIDGHDAVRQVIQLKPDILLLDLLLPQLPGIETLRELTTVTVPVRTLLLCSAITKRQVVEALQLGARGVILKSSTGDLLRALDVVMAGEYWLHGKSVSNIVKTLDELSGEQDASPVHRELMGLTRRELDIVSLVAEGCQNKDIATRLGIAEDTVKRHLTNIFNKVGTSTRLELALFAVDRHLVIRRPDGASKRPH
jgi:two-component system nitrate/nitrite response regulator NarL